MRRGLGAALVCLGVLPGCRDPGTSEPVPDPQVRFLLPLGGVPGRDWVINNYVDREPGAGVRDYRGGRKSYNRHQGTDWDVPNLRWMDRGFPVLAAAEGRVTAVHDGEFDRNVSCGFLGILKPPNLVELTHADGTRSRYLHLRQGSVKVGIGQRVAAGEPLGEVGSSGCSTAPHLHFEVRGLEGGILDPFEPNLWTDPPPYEVPLKLMDFVVKDGAITGEDELKEPPANAERIAPRGALGVGLSTAGGAPGDRLEVRLEGAATTPLTALLDEGPPHRYWFWNVSPPAHHGLRRLSILVNGAPAANHEFRPHPQE